VGELLQGCPMEKAANIATLNENHPQTVEHLMRMADEALYKGSL